MKSAFVLVSLLVFCSVCDAQSDTLFNQTGANGVKQGFWKIRMEQNGRSYMYAMESYKDGERDGLCIYYYPSGRIRDERNFRKGILHGASKVYRISGTLQYEEEYDNGKVHGIKKFYNTDGKLTEEQEFQEGVIAGIYRLYSKTNKVLVESYYVNGLENGTRKVFSDNEKHEITKEFDFRNGVTIASRFYRSGKLLKEEKFDYEEGLKKREEIQKQQNDPENE